MAAEACGISFLPASEAHIQRLAMQRKIFYRDGAPILATRGDGFFETVGTLQRLIEEGRQQQHDVTQWMRTAEPAAAAAEPPPSATEPASHKRQRRKRPAASPRLAEAAGQAPEALSEPLPTVPEPVPVPLPRTADRAAPQAAGMPAQERGKRWLVAGAERRGRAAKHWSTRQR